MGSTTNNQDEAPTRWWFQMLFIFTPTWGNDPINRHLANIKPLIEKLKIVIVPFWKWIFDMAANLSHVEIKHFLILCPVDKWHLSGIPHHLQLLGQGIIRQYPELKEDPDRAARLRASLLKWRRKTACLVGTTKKNNGAASGCSLTGSWFFRGWMWDVVSWWVGWFDSIYWWNECAAIQV